VAKPIRIIYAGTPDFAVPALSALVASEHDVVAVYTQPDRPAGRGRELRPSPVKQQALLSGIPVLQPATLKSNDELHNLQQLDADLMVVAAYGLLLPKAILEVPRLGCINIHASLLPRWRGAAPIQRAILSGDEKTGITIMQMDVGLDTGAMLAVRECAITPDDTGSSVHDQLMQLGAETLIGMLPAFINGEIAAEAQDETQVTYASKLSKQEAEINWSQSAAELQRCVRAYNAWPVAFTHWLKNGKQEILRVWQSMVIEGSLSAKPGTVLKSDKLGIDVQTGDGVLRLLEVQPAGKKTMSAADFVNAHKLDDQVLGGA